MKTTLKIVVLPATVLLIAVLCFNLWLSDRFDGWITLPETNPHTSTDAEEPSEQEHQSAQMQVEKVDINTATASQLQTLPGIGEKRAAEIVNYRTQIGRFQSTDQIVNVKGIGDGIYNNIKDLIFVS